MPNPTPTIIRPTTFLSPPVRSPPPSTASRPASSQPPPPPSNLQLITSQTLKQSHYYAHNQENRPPPSPRPPRPPSPSLLLSSFLNDSNESSSFPDMSNLSARKTSFHGPSPTPSDDSLSRFIQRSERARSPTNSQKNILVLAGAKLTLLFVKVVKVSVMRAFMTWAHNASHVRTSIICGGRILKGVHDRRAVKSLLLKFNTWKILSHLYSSDRTRLEKRKTSVLKSAIAKKQTLTLRSAFNRLQSSALANLKHDIQLLNTEHSSLSTDFSRLLKDFDRLSDHATSLASRTFTAETNTVRYNNRMRRTAVGAGLMKLNTLMCSKTTLSLIWGKPSSDSTTLLRAFSGHPCAKLFRKWDILTRASSWAERARSTGLSENLEWHQDRVENLTKQMASLQTQADEKTWSVDVMAKQVVRGAEENANMKLIIDDLQEKLTSHQLTEKNLRMEVDNFKEMLEAQLERVIEHGDMESSHRLPEESPVKKEKERSKVPHFGTPSKALLSRSQNSLLSRLETEAGEVMKNLGQQKDAGTPEKDGSSGGFYVQGQGVGIEDLASTSKKQPSSSGFAEHIDDKILSSVRGHPVQNVLAMNQEGLLDCFKHYSRNQHTSKAKQRKRTFSSTASTANTIDDGGVRVLDESNYMRFAREMSLNTILPNSKLLGAFRSCAIRTHGEQRPILDSQHFCFCLAVVAMLVFEGEQELTAREKVGTLLSTLDSKNRFLKYPAPILVGSEHEAILWEIFQNYCSVIDRRKGNGEGGVTSSGFAKFVKEFGILKGIPASSGKTDAIFTEVVTRRAAKSNNRRTAEVKHSGTHATNTKKMSFDDFVLSVAYLGRTIEKEGFESVDDGVVVKACVNDLVNYMKEIS